MLQHCNCGSIVALFACSCRLNSMLQCKNDIHFNPKSGTAPVFSPYSFSISQLFNCGFIVIYIDKNRKQKILHRKHFVSFVAQHFFQFISSVNIMSIEVGERAYFEISSQQLQRSSSKTLLCEKLCTYTRNSLMGNKR